MHPVIENAMYLLVLLNPASKIMFLASYQPSLSRRENFELSWKSSGAALLILLILAAVGDALLRRIFRVELYSLQVTGGLVVFMIGWLAIREGRFLALPKDGRQPDMTDLSLVPLAAPLIAGPGMIAAVIAGTIQYGIAHEAVSLTLAIGINFLLMVFSRKINRLLNRTHLLGPVIRLTGLVIAVTAMQMIFSGLKSAFQTMNI
ncbi:MAG: MarC family protein [Lentisphaeria bacterium]|nr:MarC family protein [Lentisphaeria bacterium]MBR2641964.1 MarC family protein [Lentisphaeria bacterium]